MASAGRLAMSAACDRGDVGESTAATVGDRWQQFAAWAKAVGVGRMERVDGDLVREYGHMLAEQVKDEERSASYAQDLVSAINTVMRSVSTWKSIGPVRDCGIAQRCAIRQDAPATLARRTYDQARESIKNTHGDRAAAIVGLCREIGLRSKEASLINARAAVSQVERTGQLVLKDGTKGGRDRTLSITDRQADALRVAAAVQGRTDRSMIPTGMTWSTWRDGELRHTREAMRAATGDSLHDLRAAYACERYQALTGHAPPCGGGVIEDRAADLAARKEIATELGHGRIDVVSEYVGGRS